MALERRGFLMACLALGAAPWVAKAGVLMPIRKILSGWEYFTPTMIGFDMARPGSDMYAIMRYKRVGDLIVVESISHEDFYA